MVVVIYTLHLNLLTNHGRKYKVYFVKKNTLPIV